MSRNLTAILLAAAMVLCLFAGCGNDKSPAESSAVSAVSSTSEASKATAEPSETVVSDPEPAVSTEETVEAPTVTYPISDDGATISYWFAHSPDLPNLLPNYFDDCTAWKAGEEATGVTVDFTYCVAQAASETFDLMVASGDYPDLLDNCVDRYSTGAEGAIADEVILDLVDLIDTDMPDYAAVLAQHPDVVRDITTDEGHMAGIYTVYDEVRQPDAGPMIRKDWLEALDLEVPQTYDDYKDVLLAFKNAYGCSTPLALSSDGVPENNYLVAGYGVAGKTADEGGINMPFYVVDGQVKYGIVEEGFREYVTMLNQWFNEGLISSDYPTADNGTTGNLVVNGQSGIWYGGSGAITLYSVMVTDPEFHAVAIPDAVKKEGDVNHFSTVTTYNAPVSISAIAENPSLCAQWLNFWFTEQGSQLANYGVEGEGCAIAEDGTAGFSDLILNNPDGTGYRECLSLYTVTCVPYYSHVNRDMVTYTEDVAAASGIWASNRDNEYNYPKTASLTTQENEDFASLYSDITTVINEQVPTFVLGIRSMNEWDSFVQGLKDMGIEDCIALKQDAYDRYIAR